MFAGGWEHRPRPLCVPVVPTEAGARPVPGSVCSSQGTDSIHPVPLCFLCQHVTLGLAPNRRPVNTWTTDSGDHVHAPRPSLTPTTVGRGRELRRKGPGHWGKGRGPDLRRFLSADTPRPTVPLNHTVPPVTAISSGKSSVLRRGYAREHRHTDILLSTRELCFVLSNHSSSLNGRPASPTLEKMLAK